jgi:glycosyltransferase involved in cell wall biosynthesis
VSGGVPASADAPSRRSTTRRRLCLILPSTGEFDSRAYRIATSAVARGHEVTVLARSGPGLPDEELHPAGYRVIRVPVSAMAGMPFPRLMAGVRAIGARVYGRRATSTQTTPTHTTPTQTTPTQATPSGTHKPTGDPPATRKRPPFLVRARRAVVAAPRRTGLGLIHYFAIPLTIRSQRIALERVAPAADVYHGMAYSGVPTAIALARRHDGVAVYDARDIYVEAASLARRRGLIRWLVDRNERTAVRAVRRVITVNKPYAEVMARRWATDEPLVVLNCAPRRTPPAETSRRIHEALGLTADQRVILYHGKFSPNRGIEQLIAAMEHVGENAVLVLLGFGELQDYLASLGAQPAVAGRVRILPAVPPSDLLDWVASADIVAMPIQPSTLNHRLTTPNKLFEAIAVGAPVVASDLPGMAPIVREIDAGVLVDPTDAAAIAEACRTILAASPESNKERRGRILRAAAETYNWERQADVLFAEYARLTGAAW